MRVHASPLIAGVVFVALGVAFILEALDMWAFQLADLRLVGPIALLAVGIGVAVGSVRRARRED